MLAGIIDELPYSFYPVLYGFFIQLAVGTPLTTNSLWGQNCHKIKLLLSQPPGYFLVGILLSPKAGRKQCDHLYITESKGIEILPGISRYSQGVGPLSTAIIIPDEMLVLIKSTYLSLGGGFIDARRRQAAFYPVDPDPGTCRGTPCCTFKQTRAGQGV